MTTQGQKADFVVPMQFLKRDKFYDTTKPYSVMYYMQEDFPRNNLKHVSHDVEIHDMRQLDSLEQLDTRGFGVSRMKTAMQYVDWENFEQVGEVYCRELEDHLAKKLSAQHVRALDFQIRKRSPEFPYFGGRIPAKPQPSLMVHVDVTPEATESIIQNLYPELADDIIKSRYQIITVWKPLKCPVRDWPLAICDASSLSKDDLVPSDVLYPKFHTENMYLHFDESQKWYWLPDQSEDELLLFKSTDSGSSRSWPCPHGAFPLPSQISGEQQRESIDVRLLIMYREGEYPKGETLTESY